MRTCPFCETAYVAEGMESLQTSDGMHLVHIACETCGHAMMALFIASEFGTGTFGIMTDLSREDAQRIVGLSDIHLDDVLNFHVLVQDGRLFEKHVLLSTKSALKKY